MIHLLTQNQISKEDQAEILKLGRIQQPGPLLLNLRYAQAVMAESLISVYREAVIKTSDTPLDVEKEVPCPTDEDLIGLEPLLEEIRINILHPIALNHPDIPMKKGILVAGPPGTGKTSLGRWLAHQLRGKFYLIGGESGISGPSFIDTVGATLGKAMKQAPAVVFIDDVDTIFSQPDSYRALLTQLDGLDNSSRTGVCVIVTCMDIRKVPASLLRGGRLELCLTTTLPNRDSVARLVDQGLDKLQRVYLDVKKLDLIIDPSLRRHLITRMLGWNCADINRCFEDALRYLTSEEIPNLTAFFDRNIELIQEQYRRCQYHESDSERYQEMFN
jgi:SpoVK/Ycf46/Vps4 family AAA+-type ATPase